MQSNYLLVGGGRALVRTFSVHCVNKRIELVETFGRKFGYFDIRYDIQFFEMGNFK